MLLKQLLPQCDVARMIELQPRCALFVHCVFVCVCAHSVAR
jgi:hypothetical protein